MNVPLVEVFPSFQGEGKWIGTYQLFVRFYGCNIQCSYCDTHVEKAPEQARVVYDNTEQIIQHPVSVSQCADIISQYSPHMFHSLVFTGGEPLLHSDIIKKISGMVSSQWKFFLETNGTCSEQLAEIIDDIHYVSMDYKLYSVCGEQCSEKHQLFLDVLGNSSVQWYVKCVVNNDIDSNEFLQALSAISSAHCSCLVLQPQWGVHITQKKLVELFEHAREKCPDVRIIPQCHKILGID